jgi:hypothetical protein
MTPLTSELVEACSEHRGFQQRGLDMKYFPASAVLLFCSLRQINGKAVPK